LHAGSNQNLILIPTFYVDASVLPAVNRDRAATQRQRLLSNFAIADQPVVVPAVLITRQRTIFIFALLFLRQACNTGERQQRSNQHTSA
jgi:hypothetical protein